MKARLTLFGMPLIGVETGQDAGGAPKVDGKSIVSNLKATVQKTALKVVEKTTPEQDAQVQVQITER